MTARTPVAEAGKQRQRCGVERWDIKTLSDDGAKKVNFNPQETTIEWLVSQKRPPGTKLPNYRLPQEFQTYRIRGLLVAYKRESDGDFHVIVANPNNRRQTMVVEIPDPKCEGANGPGFADTYRAARSTINHLIGSSSFGTGLVKPSGDVFIKVDGVAFFDQVRGQPGMAPNGIELHPVFQVQADR